MIVKLKIDIPDKYITPSGMFLQSVVEFLEPLPAGEYTEFGFTGQIGNAQILSIEKVEE